MDATANVETKELWSRWYKRVGFAAVVLSGRTLSVPVAFALVGISNEFKTAADGIAKQAAELALMGEQLLGMSGSSKALSDVVTGIHVEMARNTRQMAGTARITGTEKKAETTLEQLHKIAQNSVNACGKLCDEKDKHELTFLDARSTFSFPLQR